MAGSLVKSTHRTTRIHWKLKDLKMAFLKTDHFVVFLCWIEGKMREKWRKMRQNYLRKYLLKWIKDRLPLIFFFLLTNLRKEMSNFFVVSPYSIRIREKQYFTWKSLFSLWFNIGKRHIGQFLKRPSLNFLVFNEF